MMTLENILEGINVLSTYTPDVQIESLCFDSREAKKGSLFFAIPGTQVDGHDFLTQVAQTGCEFALVEKDVQVDGLTCIKVENNPRALAIAAHNFYGKPSEQLTLVGITGTNGKTTTTTLLHDLFQGLGYDCGLISTVVNKIGDKEIPSTHTTPNAIALAQLMKQMVDEGCTHAFMEVSSHAIHQSRTAALDFDVAGFTNISHDHLDYHKTFKEYIDVKKTLFDNLKKEAQAIVNIDDKNGMVMLQNCKATKNTYALKSPADYKAKILENNPNGLLMIIDGQEIWSNLIGGFNGYNLLTVYSIGRLLDIDKLDLLTAMSKLQSVEGRFNYVKSEKGITCIVDYAHTPDALENVLKTLNDFTNRGRIITICGCGGDRDKTKRPIMAKIAASMSDQAVLTSDNPRTEDPTQILNDMQAGLDADTLGKALVIENRKEAIKTGIVLAQPGDMVLIAGKGHEKYQDIQGVKHDFDDMAIAKEILTQLKK